MELRILGPVELVNDGDAVALGGPQRQVLLAMLLSRAGQICSPDLLADVLWGDDRPPAAASALHAHVSRLRSLLEPGRQARSPAQVLRSVDGGYVLDVGGHEVDAAKFRAVADDGAAALRADDPERAKAAYTEALALWRGPAFGELNGHPHLLVPATELDERRASAGEGLFEARLRLGEHAEIVDDAPGLVDAHPFRERMWAQLMLALYRCGRQADALAAYRRCRRRLIDDLGIEPGAELHSLEQAVLLQKPELDWHAAGEPPALPTDELRRPLPSPPTRFVGRDREIADVSAALEQHRLVTVTGPGGVGKTRLAVEVATVVADRFRHGVAFCDLVAVPSGDHLEGTIADAIGMHVAARADADRLVDHLVNRELLLVIDNAERLVGDVGELVDRLVDRCARVRVLVTSREPVGGGERLVRLRPLPTDQPDAGAAELFVDRARLAAPNAELDADTVGELCRRLDGMPLAIELAASRLRSIPLEYLVTALDDQPATINLVPIARSMSAHGTLQGVIDWSVDLLPAAQQALLRRLAVFAGGCTAAAAAAVCEIDTDPVDALGALVDRSLVQLDTTGDGPRYRLLETIRTDGLARLADHGEIDRFRARHLTWCRSLAPAEPGHGEDPDTVAGLAAEIDNVVTALAWSLDGGDAAAGVRLAIAAAQHWAYTGRLREGRGWLEGAAAATATSSAEHRLALRWLGWVLARQSDLGAARAVLTEACSLAAAAGDDDVAVGAEILLATVEVEAGDLTPGETRLRRLLDTAPVRAEAAHRAVITRGLGRRALAAGDLRRAGELLERAVREARDAGTWHTLARALADVAQVESGRKRFPRAEGAFAEALTVARRHRLLGVMPTVLGAGAVLAARHGDRELSRTRLGEALSAAQLAGDLRAELATHSNLGALDLDEGQPRRATEHFEEALVLANRIDDERLALRVIANLSESVLASGHDTDRALLLAAEALRRGRPLGLRFTEVAAIESAAMTLVTRGRSGDLARAAGWLGAAAAERERLDYPVDAVAEAPVAAARRHLGEVLGDDRAESLLVAGRRRGLDSAGDEVVAAAAAIQSQPAP